MFLEFYSKQRRAFLLGHNENGGKRETALPPENNLFLPACLVYIVSIS